MTEGDQAEARRRRGIGRPARAVCVLASLIGIVSLLSCADWDGAPPGGVEVWRDAHPERGIAKPLGASAEVSRPICEYGLLRHGAETPLPRIRVTGSMMAPSDPEAALLPFVAGAGVVLTTGDGAVPLTASKEGVYKIALDLVQETIDARIVARIPSSFYGRFAVPEWAGAAAGHG